MRIFPAVGIIGPRQCGKTTMAKLIRKELGDKAAYYDLEDPVDNAKFDNASFLLSNLKAKTIIIDEVQRRPELFAILRSVIDKNRRNGRFLLLGSASPEMVRGSSESLAGRIGFIDATPFQLTELPDTIEAMNKHWLRGGFPGAWLARNSSDAHAWMNSFTRTFIERDLNSLFGTTFTPSVMFRLWRMIAHHHAQVWNAASFAKGLDVSAMTVNRYVDHLSGAFMVRKLQPWYENNKKRLTKAPKIYIRDSGVLHHLLGIHDMNTLLNHPVVGHSWEGYVVEQICNALPPSVFPHYYRTHDGAEMDLVLVKGIRPVACVEVKFNTAPVVTRGMAQSITDLRPKKSFIVTPGDVHSWSVRKGITVCGLRPFLEKELPGLIK
ncbi:MAG TPA: ATP-binding protein [Bacteroidia bacterium]|jgi:predicted AAA+ superfamily ATPase|nr:ATP-binding protein [Bacteroidia bacterium]